ncbi:unnamed protein product [Malus baccata var. baccata]
MGKNNFLTPKAISNRTKDKGLQKLRCHIVNSYSEEFERSFLDLMKWSHQFSRIAAIVLPCLSTNNEYINDRHQVHMNSTETGKCTVDETRKGWFIMYIDRDSETLFKERLKNKRPRADMADEEKQEREIKKQIERVCQSMEVGNGSDQGSEAEANQEVKVNLNPVVKIGFALGGECKIGFDEAEDEMNDRKVKKAKNGSGGDARRLSLEELMRKEEKKKERINRKDYWLREGIVVKGYYKQKGIVRKVIDSKHVLRVDQAELEAVIPTVGCLVKIVNGAYRGSNAKLLAVDKNTFALRSIEKGVYDGRVLKAVQYEDICKLG